MCIRDSPDNAQEVATMDDEKLELLKDIFWQMNEISSSTSTQTETVIETSDDGNGNIVETAVTVTRTYLYITVSHKTAEEMADQFGFNEDQREQMAELLADENNSLWSQVLYLSLIHISEPTRQAEISYAVFCLKKKKSTRDKQKYRIPSSD